MDSELLSAGASLIGSITGAAAAAQANRKQHEYEREMYEKQKKDSLEFWSLQNQYNAPEMQMQRLKQAGLNPNLVYGGGATQSGADLSLKPMSISNSVSARPNPLAGLPESVSNIYDLRVKQAQANLLNEQALTQQTTREVQAVEAALKRLDVQRNTLDYRFNHKTYDTRRQLLESQQLNLLQDLQNKRSQNRLITAQIGSTQATTSKTLAETSSIKTNQRIQIDQNIRAWQHQKLSLAQAYENIQQTKSATAQNRASTELTKINQDKAQIEILDMKIKQELTAIDQLVRMYDLSPTDGLLNQLSNYANNAFGRILDYRDKSEMLNNLKSIKWDIIEKATKPNKK